MANASLGEAVLRTRLDRSGLNRGLDQSRREVKSWGRSVGRNLQDIGGSLGALVGSAGLLYGLRQSAKAAQNATIANRIYSRSLERFGVSAGKGAQLVSKLSERFGVQRDVIQSATTLLLRNGATLEGVGKLLLATGASAAAAGKDVAKAMTNVATGVSVGRSELLEYANIVTNLSPAEQAFAESIGKTVDQLTQQQKIQARVTAIVKESRFEVEALDEVITDLTKAEQDWKLEQAQTVRQIGKAVIPAYKGLLKVGTAVLGFIGDLPAPIRNAGLAAVGAAVGVTALAGAASLLYTVLLPILGPAGIIIGAAALIAGVGAAFLSQKSDIEQAVGAYEDAQEAIGKANDKEALLGALANLSKNLKGEAKEAVKAYAEEVRGLEGDLEEAKERAQQLASSLLAPVRAKKARLQTELDALLQLEGGLNAPDVVGQERVEVLTEKMLALQAAGDARGASRIQRQIAFLNEAIRTGENVNEDIIGISDRRATLEAELAKVNARLAAAVSGGTGTEPKPEPDKDDPPTIIEETGDAAGTAAPKIETLAEKFERLARAQADLSNAPLGVQLGAGYRAPADTGAAARIRADTVRAQQQAQAEARARALANPFASRTARGAAGSALSPNQLIPAIEDAQTIARVQTAVGGFFGRVVKAVDTKTDIFLQNVVDFQLTAFRERQRNERIAKNRAFQTIATPRDIAEQKQLQDTRFQAREIDRLTSAVDPAYSSLLELKAASGESAAKQREVASAASYAAMKLIGAGIAFDWAAIAGYRDPRFDTGRRRRFNDFTKDQIGKAGEENARAAEQAAAEEIAAAEQFKQTIVQAAGQAGNILIGAISGQIGAGGIISGLGGAAASIVSTINPLAGAIVGVGSSLLGGLVSLFGGGPSEAEQARREQAQRAQGAPALSISAIVNQNNTFSGGLTDPATQAALDTNTRTIVKEVLTQLGVGTLLREARGAAPA